MNNEPVAIRYDYDGYGYQYIDSGSGSDWQTRVQGEPLYTAPPQIEVGCAECGVNDNYALYCVACAEKFVGEATTKLQQKQETIEGLNRDYDLLFAEHQLLLKKEWIGLTDDDKVLIKHDANFNQFTTAGEYADRVQQLTEARLKDKNTK